jgi:hypothetical protein
MDNSKRLFTIEQYSAYVLNDKRVVSILERFFSYKKLGKEALDFIKQNKQAESARDEFLGDLASTTEHNLRGMLASVHPDRWMNESIDVIAAREHRIKGPYGEMASRSDLPLIIFRRFTSHYDFKDYLFTGQVPLMNSTYFLKELDKERQLHMVFSVFIWLTMDGKQYNEKHQASAYYSEGSHKLGGIEMYRSEATNNRSTYEDRYDFLESFREYIHYDLWGSQDYVKRRKTGKVARLRLSTGQCGNVVLQSCSGSEKGCNDLYLITEDILYFLKQTYLSVPYPPLTKLSLTFHCRHCGNENASHLVPEENTRDFYCDIKCYNACQ